MLTCTHIYSVSMYTVGATVQVVLLELQLQWWYAYYNVRLRSGRILRNSTFDFANGMGTGGETATADSPRELARFWRRRRRNSLFNIS